MSHLLRTRIANEIVAEVGIPERPNGKLIILLDGMPSLPQQGTQIRFLMKHRYSVIHPRYRGSWESSGKFLNISPEQDVIDILDSLSGDFNSAWDGEVFQIPHDEVIIICSSFGGPAGLLSARDSRVSKVIAFSPVVDWADWSKNSPEEPFYEFKEFVKAGFGEGYRIPEGNLEKLKTGEFYNPSGHIEEIPGEKIFIIHAEDDRVVIPGPTLEFAKVTKSKILTLKKGGHVGRGLLKKSIIWWKVKKFLKS